MTEGIIAARKFLNETQSIYEPSFGPYGKDILLKSNTGTIYVTKNGLTILRHLEIQHPIGSMIQKSIETYTSIYGDFSKSFVIVLSTLIEQIYTKYFSNQQSFTHNNNNMVNFMLCRRLQVVKSLFSSSEYYDYMIGKAQKHYVLSQELIITIFKSFMTNQYSIMSMEAFENIIIEIQRFVSFSKHNLQYIIHNFHELCLPVYGLQLHHSKVIQGVIIEREPIPRDTSRDMDSLSINKQCCFIILTGSLERGGNDITIKITDDNYQQKEQLTSIRLYKQLIKILLLKNVTVIFSEQSLPHQFAVELTKHDIIQVPYIQETDIENLCKRYSVVPISGLYDIYSLQECHNITSTVIGNATFFKSCILGKKYSSHLGPKLENDLSKNCQIFNFQILVCSLSEGLGVQYRETLYSFFKILYHSFWKDNTSTQGQIPVELSVKLDKLEDLTGSKTSKDTPSKDTCQIPVSTMCRSVNLDKLQDLTSSKTAQNTPTDRACQIPVSTMCRSVNLDKLQDLTVSKSSTDKFKVPAETSNTICLLFPSGGAFEIMTRQFIYNNPNKNITIENDDHVIIELFTKSLLQIPKIIFNNSNKTKNKRFIIPPLDIIGEGYMKTSCLGIDGVTGEIVDMNSYNFFEPLKSKLMLVDQILNVCIQIIRIDQIVSVQKSIRTLDDDEDDGGVDDSDKLCQ